MVTGGTLSACAPPAVKPAANEAGLSAAFPLADYRRALERGEPVYRVDAVRSRIVIEVRRGGTFAEAGHDHVVASHDVQGIVAPDAARADLYVALDRLVVDEPALRVEAGFDAAIPEAAVAATRANMLNRVLHADEHPFATVRVTAFDADRRALDATITVNGVSRPMRIPVAVQKSGQALRVDGALALEQTDFGIVPLSLFNGAIQVQNRVAIRFSIEARRIDSLPAGAASARED